MKQVTATVISNTRLLPEVHMSHGTKVISTHLVWLHCPEIEREAKAGQFVMVRCGDECLLPRPFSIHHVDNNGNIALFFGVLENGKGTKWLAQRQADDKAELFGALGTGFSIKPTSRNLLLVAGGIGVAPLFFLSQRALKEDRSITMLLGAQTQSGLYPEHLLPRGIEVVFATADGSVGYKGMVTDLIAESAKQADQIFACGPLPMYKTMAQMAELKAKPVQVSLEIMMGCGRGVCYGCTIKTKQGLQEVCQDGPVFNLDDILWDELS